jgi:hypothetical protein
MDWETIIPISIINISSTMMLIEETQEPRYPRTKHIRMRAEASLPLATPEWRSERKGSNRSPVNFVFGTVPSLCGFCVGEKTAHRGRMHDLDTRKHNFSKIYYLCPEM